MRLGNHARAFASVGWFIPPYVHMGFLEDMALDIDTRPDTFSQTDLEGYLAQIHDAQSLAAMVLHRYPIVPFVRDYKITIAEATEAHFFGLDKVAVAGLLPVVEGIAKKVAADRGISKFSLKNLFELLAQDYKAEAGKTQTGEPDEIITMADSFLNYTKNHLFADDRTIAMLPDNTNRHAILHGQYTDADFGRPINFYKVISAVDFLCFVLAIKFPISMFAPDISEDSFRLGEYYKKLENLKFIRSSMLLP